MENHAEPDLPRDLTPPGGDDAPEAPSGQTWLGRNVPYVLLVVGALALLSFYFHLSVLTLLVVFFGLGMVIFIHELGHFLVAKWCDVHVETFSIGFGPALPGCRFRWGETTYMIALFPLGGYVKMVGEGPDSDEGDDDPRSFKNKPVWQRMAIISAGVVMNVLLGCACFVIAYLHGVEQSPGVVGLVDVGSAAWEKGVPSGAVIEQVGSSRDPFFEDLKPQVMLSHKGEQLPLVYRVPGESAVRIDIEPRRDENSTHPVIGVAPPVELKLPPREPDMVRDVPVMHDSAAARAEPAFEFGDEIVGTTDPARPDRVTELPRDPRNTQRSAYDYFAFQRRMTELAGKETTIRVRRPAAGGEVVDVRVPPAFYHTLGMRMRMGKVTSIRDGSPAQQAGVQKGDILKRVEVQSAAGKKLHDFREEEWDPLRLPDDVARYASGQPGARVVLTVLRANAPNGTTLEPAVWEAGWRFDQEVQLNSSSPLPIAELGLAYQVETTVVAVDPGSPAERAGLKKDDIITGIRFLLDPKAARDAEHWGDWIDLHTKQGHEEVYQPWWARIFWMLQHQSDYKEVQLRVKRDKDVLAEPLTVRAEEDRTWPIDDRGLFFRPDYRVQKAASFGQALGMGVHSTTNFITQVYGTLVSIFRRQMSPKLLRGPITIAHSAYVVAGRDYNRFVLLMGIISVNLAVINFLPIPVLDGGHMVFLVYEKLRGRPASEQVRSAATYVGLALILCLMIFVLYQDIAHRGS